MLAATNVCPPPFEGGSRTGGASEKRGKRTKGRGPGGPRKRERGAGFQMTLDQLGIGKKSRILQVRGQGALRRRLLDMGLTPRTEVMVRKMAPMGDPMEIHLRGYELTIRLEDAKNIVIEEESAG